MALLITLEKPPDELPKVGIHPQDACMELANALADELGRQVSEMNPAMIRLAKAYCSGMSVVFIYMHDELKEPIITGPKVQIPRLPEAG